MNKIKYVAAVLIAIAGFGLQQAKAYTVTLEQMGADVVANGSGPIDLTGLTFENPSVGGFAHIRAVQGNIVTGLQSDTDTYSGFTGPANFGSGDLFAANTSSGDFVGINALNGFIFVPRDYVSGAALSDSMTFDNATFASLAVTPGTFVWTWGGGANQNFTLIIPGVPDGGATVMLLGMALGVLGMARRFLMS
jgi:protein with PEP-CTERM/exosortase system signal